ncbi:NXPE family member 3-like [Ylistrum balloti]|uniref:NXPE family member 3-like n=1 Tax=Ylistrum balloti TaxID=509963 RepID=UPI002905BEBB|nr:NXPE family member 3-like [Ylistrum balloti]
MAKRIGMGVRWSQLSKHMQGKFANVTKDQVVHSSNVIKTAFILPTATISRNILERYPEYRQIHEVKDFKELFDPRFSMVELDMKKDQLRAGSQVKVKVHLYNGYNQSMTRGGDLLNIWLRDVKGDSYVAGYVDDHMNGTYTGHVMAFWAGNVTIKVTVTSTKEGIGLYTNYVHKYGSYKFISGTFSKNDKSEKTLCAPTNTRWLDRKYRGLCNLTKENYNISLFCGKPDDIPCRNWVTYGWNESLFYDGYTKKILSHKDLLLKQIQVNIAPSSNGHLDYPLPKTPCNVLPRELTWNSTVPSGFTYRGIYYNLICQLTMNQTKPQYRACLKDRQVISIGDSTTRQWYYRLLSILGFEIKAENTFNKFVQIHNKTLGLDLEWQPHELPFHGVPGSDRKVIKSVAFRLDKIPANSKAIVIIHWYAHIVRCCDHIALRQHVRNAKEAIVRLLARSPDVKIFIKGPHLVTYFNARKPYKFVGMFVEQVLLEEFSDLLDKLTYLDQWDMSVAAENVNIHPENTMVNISLNNLMNFACNIP